VVLIGYMARWAGSSGGSVVILVPFNMLCGAFHIMDFLRLVMDN